jgi:hypothetical protein
MSAEVRVVSGRIMRRNSRERWMLVPATKERGHSRASIPMPKKRFMICKIGTGFTAPSRFLVRKSQKILGQKKPSTAAATWSI